MYKSPHIPLLPHLRIAWKHRKALLKAAGIGLLVGLLIALSLPREYTATILLSPESISYSNNTSLDAWTDDMMPAGQGKERDAITPDFYPYIVSSPNFLITFFNLPVQTVTCPPDSTLTLYDYLDQHQRRPWWGFLTAAAAKLTHWLTSPLREEERDYSEAFPADTIPGGQPTILALSAKDTGIAAALNARLSVKPDVKTRTVTLSCHMQDPLVAATVADSLSHRIKDYITEYRTRKAREELAAAQKLRQQALEKYYQAQETQAAFEDRNRDLTRKDAQKEAVKLRILTEQAYRGYVQAVQQMQAAQVKVARLRPVFAVIQPATTPVTPSSPGKLKYMAAFALLGLLAGYARICYLRIKSKFKPQENRPSTPIKLHPDSNN